MKKYIHSLLSVACLMLAATSTVSAQQDQVQIFGTDLQEKATKEILNTLKKKHFSAIDINDQLSGRLLENYLEKLDPSKAFFQQQDIDEFSSYQNQLDDQLKAGENTAGFIIYNRLVMRMTSRLQRVINWLESPKFDVDFSKDEYLITDNESLAWPQNQDEADQRWKKRIKSYFLAQKLNGETIKSSKESLLKRYRSQYERARKNTAEDVYEIYMNAFTELYDPHTNYFSPRSSESFSIRMSLSLEGIGAVLQSEDGYTKVIRIVTGGPADKQGELKASDKIAGVAQGDGEMVNIIGWRLDEVVALIRGPKDSTVRLEVISDDSSGVGKIVEIKRDKVKLEDQAAKKSIITLNNNGKSLKLGVIDIPTFYMDFEAYRKRDPNYRSTAKDVRKLLVELENEGVDGIIVDLRDNGGGSLYEATAVTDLFIDQGPVVQIGKDGGRKTSDFSKKRALYRGPLLVLINRLSASASEIFAGAVQDYRRGIIVGAPSFGKGTVQTLVPLNSQGELKITQSKFYRVSGGSTQHKGIIPDIHLPELIDAEEVGESSYDTALAWSKTQPVRHGQYPPLAKAIQQLTKQHQYRLSTDPDLVYLQQQRQLLDDSRSKKKISLHEATRRAEKQAKEAQALAIENLRRKAKGLSTFADFGALTEYNDDKQKKMAEANNTVNVNDDAILQEGAAILKDFIHQLSHSK